MKKFLLAFLAATAISIAWLFVGGTVVQFVTQCYSPGFECAGVGIYTGLIHFIAIPIAFGIAGSRRAERRGRQGFAFFLISLVAAVVVFVPSFLKVKADRRVECERAREESLAFQAAHPELIKNAYVPPPCE